MARDVVLFERGDHFEVAEAMRTLSAAGRGWINIGPELTDDEADRVPQRSALAAWLSGRGPAVAMATWVPAATSGRARPAQLGIEHGTGPDALARLADGGLGLPRRWVRRQDHAKNGLVIDLPDHCEPEAILAWAVAATHDLQAVARAGERWRAVVHRPAR